MSRASCSVEGCTSPIVASLKPRTCPNHTPQTYICFCCGADFEAYPNHVRRKPTERGYASIAGELVPVCGTCDDHDLSHDTCLEVDARDNAPEIDAWEGYDPPHTWDAAW